MRLLFIVPAPCITYLYAMPKGKTSFVAQQCFFLPINFVFMPKKISPIFGKSFFLKICASLVAGVQRSAFSFALSIRFIALPMHCRCTTFDADPGS